MTERRAMDQFETRFADRARAYTDPATERRIDALAISRTAMSSGRATGWSRRRPGAGLFGRRIAGLGWAAVFVAVLIGVVGVAVLGRSGPQPTPAISPTPSPAPSADGPIPDVLRHSWQRPYAVTPDLDQWPPGFLVLASGQVDFGTEPGPAASRSAISAAGLDTLVVTATVETQGCEIGDIGAYRWLVEGKGTILTLTAISADACPARDKALAGQWVRSDLPIPGSEVTLQPGTYFTAAFDPFDAPGASEQLSYTVPEGWKIKEDEPDVFLLHQLPDPSPGRPVAGSFVSLFMQPRVAADFPEGAMCGPVDAAPGVGGVIDDVVEAIMARPGVISTPPTSVTIGGFGGQMLDVHVAPSWTRGCEGLEGLVVGIPILVQTGSGTGPFFGIDRDHPLRLILLDLAGERTMAIVVFSIEPTQPSRFEELLPEVMPIIESFEFHPPMP